MTARRKKTLTIALVAIVLISILRETGIFDFSLYKSIIKSETGFDWSDNSLHAKYPLDEDKSFLNMVNDKCNYEGRLAGTPVYATYNGTVYGDNKCDAIEVRIDDISYGVSWTPLFKSTSFSAKANCSIQKRRLVFEDEKISATDYNLNGTIAVKGHVTIKGVLSYRNARALIRTHIINAMIRQVQDHIANK